jgi:hypothetical protein
MAFGATITLTVNAVAKVLNRINQDNYGSEYLLVGSLDEYRLKIRHSKEAPSSLSAVGFDRHNLEVTHTVFATSTVPRIVRQAYIVLRNDYSDDKTAVGYLDAAMVDYVDSGTVQADLISWQN